MLWKKKYCVALSYASEDKEFVSSVSAYLLKKKVTVFNYEDELKKIELSGKNLPIELEKIYRWQSKYVALFISKDYKTKEWTKLEMHSALTESILRKKEYLILGKLDDTNIPEIPDILAYIDLKNLKPEKFAELIISRIKEDLKKAIKNIIEIIIFLLLIGILIWCYFTCRRDGLGMACIPSGNFIMGTSKKQIDQLTKVYPEWKSDLYSNETPEREIYLKSYCISIYEISNKQYGKFLEDNPDHKKPACWSEKNFNDPDQPVVGVSWYDAVAFCDWLSKKNKKKYRLPTEAEWEKAARGNDNRIFPWGNEVPDTDKANFMQQCHKTKSVKDKKEGISFFGVIQMAGNAAEWCNDWYAKSSNKSFAEYQDSTGPFSGIEKVVRGGCWKDNAFSIRCARRIGYPPNIRNESIGFRIVRCLEK